ncbi:hypothetical protein [Pedobacter punctiformis]|uniref:Uncharacterized protein n=1 Tax=Pedobacter punctiformis TaxID=3004097 RepID=A0ABT4LDE0_9SPHI|nr:hypothetical protein [Pedobacter sp. HCMS5-2]MCZ4244844.1 hypothetical protein [Pedobacter sp. HCMS5-2]
MKNVDKAKLFESSTIKTDFGILTTLVADTGISAKESISFANKSLLANYVYNKNETYNLVYTIIDNDGKEESFVEDSGILPTLFFSSDNKAYVSIIPPYTNKELEISIPIFNRENIDVPKGDKPFTGSFIGSTEKHSVFYNVDIWSDTKPDQLLAIEFKNGMIKKKYNLKVSLPRNNKVFISNHEIHLLAKDGNAWLHRQIDEKGNEIRHRKINNRQKFYRQILSLSFEKDSYLLTQEKGVIIIEKIDINGKCEKIKLIDIKDPFFNTWQPVKLADDTYITRFNGEFGNGWFTTKKDTLLEIFFSKGVKGYKNLLTNEILEMEDDKLVISGINKTTENAYAIVFYPMADRGIKNNKLIVLNREIK